MNPLIPLLVLIALGSQSQPLFAQETLPGLPVSSSPEIPPDINGFRSVIPAPVSVRPLKVAIYDGEGSSKAGVEAVMKAVTSIPGGDVVLIPPAQMGDVDLSVFDVVVFSGGSARVQAKNIGELGKENVREYVRQGGGYVGICAGAYLSCSGFDWSLGILNASTVSTRWRRGSGYLEQEVTPLGQSLLGEVKGTFKVRYNNGPVIQPGSSPHIPAYTSVALFRTELAENDSPAGVMVNSPAQAVGTFGLGRVFISSPHPENTPGLENLIPRALLWAAGQDQYPARQGNTP